MKIELLAAGDFVVCALSCAMGLYQWWMSRRQAGSYSSSTRISLAVAVYALGSGLNYQFASPTLARAFTEGSYLGLIVLVAATPSFVSQTIGMPLPRWTRVRTLVDVAWGILLIATPWVLGNDVQNIVLSLLSKPLALPQTGPLGGLFFSYYLSIPSVAGLWMWRHRAQANDKAAWFSAAILLWVGAGALDSAIVLGLVASPPMFFMQYVFLVFAVAMFAQGAREYTGLLDAQVQLNLEGMRDFRLLVENAPEIIVIHREGRLVYVNQAAVSALGYDGPEQMVGRTLLEFVHPSDRELVRGRVKGVRVGEPAPLMRERLLRRDGSSVVVEVIGLITRFEGLPAVVALVRDMTPRLQVDAHLMQVDRMAAVGALAAGVCHEINNPLTFVLGNLHLLRQDLDDLGHQGRGLDASTLLDRLCAMRQALDDACVGGERVASVVRDLSLVSRQRSESSQTLDLVAVLESAARLATHELRNRARLVLDLPALPPVLGDSGRLGQVFLNLLANAAQAFDYGDVAQHQVQVSADVDSRGITVSVSDNGCGIPAETLPQIFEPFHTTKPLGKGTGLGLAICQQIVQAHDGHIDVESTVGEGTTFRVWLPRAPKGADLAEPAAQSPAQTAAQSSLDQRQSTPPRATRSLPVLLVVDDELAIVTAICRILKGRWRCIGTHSVAEALAVLAEEPVVDLILSDLLMPQQTGLDLLETVALRWPRLKSRILFMTGGTLNVDLESFLSQPDVYWIPKPLDIAGLHELLQDRLAELSRAANEETVHV